MARYGDLDAIKLKAQRHLIPNTDDDGTVRVEDAERWFLRLLDEEPTVDVVPKSEVERWRRNLEAVLEERAETKAEIAREIFAEIEKLHLHITNEFDVKRYAELKKKYTEGEE